MKLYIARHGETAWNAENKVSGRTDVPLSEKGLAQARILAEKAAILNAYRADCMTLGKEISVVRGDVVRHGKALFVDDEGALVVSYSDGSMETVNSGEASIRGMYGYV